jgi:low affinity Fe/Cu permease
MSSQPSSPGHPHPHSQSPPPQSPSRNGAHEWFRRFAQQIAHWVGTSIVFIIACALMLLWLAAGPLFHFSDTWQLTVNTGTTIITFLMVFIIQNTQNRDAKAFHLKLDELIRSIHGARNQLLDLENLSDDELEKLHQEFLRLRERSRNRRAQPQE